MKAYQNAINAAVTGRHTIRLDDLDEFLADAESCGRRATVPDDDQPSDQELVNVDVFAQISDRDEDRI